MSLSEGTCRPNRRLASPENAGRVRSRFNRRVGACVRFRLGFVPLGVCRGGRGNKSTLSFRVINLVRNRPETAELLRDFPWNRFWNREFFEPGTVSRGGEKL